MFELAVGTWWDRVRLRRPLLAELIEAMLTSAILVRSAGQLVHATLDQPHPMGASAATRRLEREASRDPQAAESLRREACGTGPESPSERQARNGLISGCFRYKAQRNAKPCGSQRALGLGLPACCLYYFAGFDTLNRLLGGASPPVVNMTSVIAGQHSAGRSARCSTDWRNTSGEIWFVT